MGKKFFLLQAILLIGLSGCAKFGIGKKKAAGIRKERATWLVEVLDDKLQQAYTLVSYDDPGRKVACAFDGAGNFHAVYLSQGRLGYLYAKTFELVSKRFLDFEDPEHPKKVRKVPPEGWRYESLPVTPSSESQGLALAVDKRGSPHIFYFSTRGLEHMVLTNSGWAVGLVTNRFGAPKTWSVTISREGAPLVVFQDQRGKFVALQPTLAGWKEQLLERPESDPGSLIHCLKVRFDENDIPHMVFLGQLNNLTTLWYTQRAPFSGTRTALGDWFASEQVFSGAENPIVSCRLDMDREGLPHLAYVGWTKSHWDGSEKLVYVRRQDAKRWIKKTIIPNSKTSGGQTAITFAASSKGVPHLAYYNAHRGGMRYWTQHADKEWVEASIDEKVELNGSPAMAIDPDGNPWILYQDASRGELRLARRVTPSK